MSDESGESSVNVYVCDVAGGGNEDRTIAMVILAGGIRTAVWSQACL